MTTSPSAEQILQSTDWRSRASQSNKAISAIASNLGLQHPQIEPFAPPKKPTRWKRPDDRLFPDGLETPENERSNGSRLGCRDSQGKPSMQRKAEKSFQQQAKFTKKVWFQQKLETILKGCVKTSCKYIFHHFWHMAILLCLLLPPSNHTDCITISSKQECQSSIVKLLWKKQIAYKFKKKIYFNNSPNSIIKVPSLVHSCSLTEQSLFSLQPVIIMSYPELITNLSLQPTAFINTLLKQNNEFDASTHCHPFCF